MAHHPSPSPSRRLSELLGEQQEPFYLDLYLLEKGCSPAFLDAAACGGGGGACSTCWPTRVRSTRARLLRRTPARSKFGRRGMLRLLLSKILSGAGTTTTTKKKQHRQQPAAAIDWRRADAGGGEKQSTPGRSANASAPASPGSGAVECRHRTDVDEEQQEEDDGNEEDDESSKKQLSPVSVLEQRLFEHSPPPPHAQKAFVLFSELIESAYAPTTLVHLLANARQYSSSVNKSKDDNRRRNSDDGGSTSATRRWRRSRNCKNKNARARREKDDDNPAFERDLAMATALVASEMPGARVRAHDVEPEREEVAAGVAAAVLDALTEEAAAELMVVMGMAVHGCCAADTAATATSVVGFLMG